MVQRPWMHRDAHPEPARGNAQQVEQRHRIGIVGLGPTTEIRRKAFLYGVQDVGYVVGQNLTIEERFAAGNADRFPALAAELAIERPIRFEFVFYLKTAETLGLTIPPILLFQADEVIE